MRRSYKFSIALREAFIHNRVKNKERPWRSCTHAGQHFWKGENSSDYTSQETCTGTTSVGRHWPESIRFHEKHWFAPSCHCPPSFLRRASVQSQRWETPQWNAQESCHSAWVWFTRQNGASKAKATKNKKKADFASMSKEEIKAFMQQQGSSQETTPQNSSVTLAVSETFVSLVWALLQPLCV